VNEVTTLGELAGQGRVVLNDGYRTRADELGAPGVPILRVAEVQDGYITPSFGDHVREAFRAKFAQKTSRANDVVVTTKGTVGRVALIRAHHPEFVYSPQVCFFRCSENSGVFPKWLYYWFNGPEFVAQALGVQSQTDMAPYINLADMRAISISIPAPQMQWEIAGVLAALDDKIESNRRIVQTAVELARRVLGGGSLRVRLRNVAEVQKGLSYKGAGLAASGHGLPMVNLANFKVDGWLDPVGLKHYDGEHKSRHEVVPGDLLVANTDLTQQRIILGRPALVPPSIELGLFTHHAFVVRTKSDAVRLGLWSQLNGPEFRERAEGFATGTTVAGMPADALLDFEFDLPSDAAVSEGDGLIRRAWRAEAENVTLSALRDALLPELLSGRMRVVDAEVTVGSLV
jgi:type I restriction enzyme S subunit